MEPVFGPIEWVKPPLQLRSKKSLERILDAAEEVITQNGFERATIAEVVKRAKSSVGVFYARFNDKDSMLALLHERFVQNAMATTDVTLRRERWAGASTAEIMSVLVPFLVRIFRDQAGLLRAFISRSAQDESFAKRAIDLNHYMGRRLSELLESRLHEISHPDPEFAIGFGLQLIVDKLSNVAFFCEVQKQFGMDFDETSLSQELTRVFLSYLGVNQVETVA